jgi:hypothetical protein
MHSDDPSLIPWYRQFWPWFIIAIPSAAIIGGLVTLWLALTHPESLVVEGQEYQTIRDELRAHDRGADGAEGTDG